MSYPNTVNMLAINFKSCRFNKTPTLALPSFELLPFEAARAFPPLAWPTSLAGSAAG
jgi:hypothetical protein